MSTDTSYDELPYTSHSFPQTNPASIAAIAALLGIDAPPIERCRVLELGCASGGNLIPLAQLYPEASYLGVDLSRVEVDHGNETVSALALENIRLEIADILEFEEDRGPFDYIICHGVFSWIPHAAQEKVFQILSKCLSPTGVALVSYNAYPGWHARGIARDIMRFHSAPVKGAESKVDEGLALMKLLGDAIPGKGPYAEQLRSEFQHARVRPVDYVFHDYLEEHNTPFHVHEFITRADRHRLRYLAEAQYSTCVMSLDALFSSEVVASLKNITTQVVRLEQYLDFLVNRTFRSTLLCHADVVPQRRVRPERLYELHVSSDAKLAAGDLDPTSVRQQFKTSWGRTAATSSPLVKVALQVLAEKWPLSETVEALFSQSMERLGELRPGAVSELADDPNDHLPRFAQSMLACYKVDAVKLRTVCVPNCNPRVDARPRAFAVARLQARELERVTNLHHEPRKLGALQRQIIAELDGTRDCASLHKMLRAAPRRRKGGRSKGAPPSMDRIQRILAAFATNALLVNQ